jgi:hypothetical protein
MIRAVLIASMLAMAAGSVALANAPIPLVTPMSLGTHAPAVIATPSAGATIPPNIAQPASVMDGSIILVGCRNLVFGAAGGNSVTMDCPFVIQSVARRILDQQSSVMPANAARGNPHLGTIAIVYVSGTTTKVITLLNSTLVSQKLISGSNPIVVKLVFTYGSSE